MKANKNKKQIKDLAYDQIHFFSLTELPETYNYMEVKITLRSSSFAITSKDLEVEMGSSHTVAELKARNMGNDLMLSVAQVYVSIYLAMAHSLDYQLAREISYVGAKTQMRISSAWPSRKRKRTLPYSVD